MANEDIVGLANFVENSEVTKEVSLGTFYRNSVVRELIRELIENAAVSLEEQILAKPSKKSSIPDSLESTVPVSETTPSNKTQIEFDQPAKESCSFHSTTILSGRNNIKGVSNFLSNFVNKYSLNKNVTESSVCIVKYHLGDVNVSIPLPELISLEQETSLFTQEVRALEAELALLYSLSKCLTGKVSFCKEACGRETHWRDTLSLQNQKREILNLLNLKRKACWCIIEIDRIQKIVLVEMFNMPLKTSINKDDRVQIHWTELPLRTRSIVQSPILQPLPEDFKPCKLSFLLACKIKHFVFEQIEPELSARFDVVGQLEQEESNLLLSRPFEFMANILRYTRISKQETIRFMFFTNIEGKVTECQCPCGAKLTPQSSPNSNITMHKWKCVFQVFCSKFLPGFIDGNIVTFREDKVRPLSLKEEAYLKDVVVKRMPRKCWETSHIAKKLKLDGNSQQNEQKV